MNLYYRNNRDRALAAQKTREQTRNQREPEWKRRQNYRDARRPQGRYAAIVRKTRRRGWPGCLSLDEWKALVVGASCHYCAGPTAETGIGLDRIDNARGYELGNVVPCCTLCNTTKGELLSYDEMLMVMRYRRERGWPGWSAEIIPAQHRAARARGYVLRADWAPAEQDRQLSLPVDP